MPSYYYLASTRPLAAIAAHVHAGKRYGIGLANLTPDDASSAITIPNRSARR